MIPPPTPDSANDLTRLNERVSRLAQEKSYLQLIISLIKKLVSSSGLDNIADNILQGLLNVIGGTNQMLYFQIDSNIYFMNLGGEKKLIDEIDDALVRSVFNSGKPVEEEHDFTETRMSTPEFCKAYTWAYPLAIGSDVVGVVKIENLHISMHTVSADLLTLFNYMAMSLNNEILGETRLKRAYDAIAQEVAERRKIEEELRQNQELLEVRVAERTVELKQVNDELRARYEVFRCILETSSDGYWRCDMNGTIMDLNSAYARLSGYSKEELIGTQVADLEEVLDPAGIARKIEQLVKTGGILFEARHRRKDGSVWDVEVSASYLDLDGGQIFAFHRDITSRKLAENERIKNENRFRLLVNTIPDLIWLKDADGVYLSCNVNFERFFGAKESDIIGKTDYDFLDRERADYFREKDRKAMESDKPVSNEEWITFADDGHRALSYTTKMTMRDNDGKLIGVLGVGRDISELRRNEEERLKLESQLQQAQKMESVGRLAGGVAHDFNNMLTIIIGNAQLGLMDTTQANPAYRHLEIIVDAAERSAEITRQLLAFSRQQPIQPKVLDLNDSISGMLKMLRRLVGEDIDLLFDPGYELMKIKIDASQVDQILANLCVNARDAIAGVGKITISTSNHTFNDTEWSEQIDASPGEYVMLSVNDNGKGIPKNVINHIFEPFYTTKEIGKGTGLGLATVFGIVKQNGGDIRVYSEPDQGATFRIYFPAVIDTAVSPPKEQLEIVGGDETILLVEDEPQILRIGSAMLTKLGYTVLPASSAEEAILIASEHRDQIQLLITDIIMPMMNGHDLSILLSKSYTGMKCLFMSGYTADIMSGRGNIHDGTDFIQKPFDLKTLAVKVRMVLGNHQ